jgi:threonine dehydrogenase-like Zn-dependent dehydrogenase
MEIFGMRALTWHGKNDIRCDTVPYPKIEHGRDAIIKVTACAICGSDLRLFDGVMPTMEKGDVLGHETMGEVVEVGSENKKLKVGDRVVVPFTISCGECFFCKKGFLSGCERSNPNHKVAEKLWGHSPAGLFGYSHMLGGYAGGQAEYLRVPYADVGPIKVPQGLTDEQVLFLSDIFPTGFMAADFCNLKGGETVAIWGCGPVGQFAIKSAFLLGTERVIAIDTVPERLALAQESGAVTLHGNRPSPCPASGDPLLPQLRDRLDRRRIRRPVGQDPHGVGHQPGSYIPHGPDAGPALPAPATRAHREGRNRSLVRNHPSCHP